MLTTGKSGTSQREILGDVKEAARVLGINLRNCFVDGKKSSSTGSGLTVIKLPVNSDSKLNGVPMKVPDTKLNVVPGPKPIPKPLKIIPKLVSSVKNIDTAGVSAWNTSLIKKNSGLRIELKEIVKEETPAEATESKPVIDLKTKDDSYERPTCDVCGAVFKENKYLFRHRYRQHGLSRKEKPSEELKLRTLKQEQHIGVKV